MFDIVGRVGVLFQAVEDIDGRFLRQDASGRETFGELGDKEDAGAGGPERGRGLVETNPVGVGLDDSPAASRGSKAREGAPVVGKRVEIDGHPARGRFEGRVAHTKEPAFMSAVIPSVP